MDTFLLVFILLACIILTGERSNAIKSIFGLLVFFILNQKIDFKNKIISSIIIVGIIFTVIFSSDYLKVRYGNQLFSHFFNKEKTIQFIEGNLYFKLYRSGYEIFKDYPIFGTGVKGFRYLCRNKIYILEKNDGCSTHPHNTYVQILVSNGIVGFALIFFAFIYILREIFKCKKKLSSKNIFDKYELSKGIMLSAIFINLWPLIPSGNFFNNWVSMIYFYPIGFYFYFKHLDETKIN